MLDISERIKHIMSLNNMSINEFEKKINVSNNTIGSAIRRKSEFKSDVLNKVLDTFPNINPIWLLTGKGSIQSNNESEYLTKEKIPNLINFLLDNHEILIKSEAYKNYIKTSMEYLYADDEREKKKDALDKLRKIALKKLGK
ncbi:helix-turn-helix transcriptional regulator [Kordia sp.]|uniref:helix-turn-helix domain-containing protein n=1 Tax=Kordia sp. TaxID=1965332 RepID=UPI0025C4FE89|nr:helix-turn-helix transcriptional regulator [Kordia sp.]MCH2197102.1 helix-turn-helix domain-containing protein [Kordia sp.]